MRQWWDGLRGHVLDVSVSKPSLKHRVATTIQLALIGALPGKISQPKHQINAPIAFFNQIVTYLASKAENFERLGSEWHHDRFI